MHLGPDGEVNRSVKRKCRPAWPAEQPPGATDPTGRDPGVMAVIPLLVGTCRPPGLLFSTTVHLVDQSFKTSIEGIRLLRLTYGKE